MQAPEKGETAIWPKTPEPAVPAAAADSPEADLHPSTDLAATDGGVVGPLSADAVHTLEQTSRGRSDVVDVSFLLQFYKQPDTIARITKRHASSQPKP